MLFRSSETGIGKLGHGGTPASRRKRSVGDHRGHFTKVGLRHRAQHGNHHGDGNGDTLPDGDVNGDTENDCRRTGHGHGRERKRAHGRRGQQHGSTHTTTRQRKGAGDGCIVLAASKQRRPRQRGTVRAWRREHARVRPAGGGTRAWPRMREDGGVRPRGWSWWRGRDAARLGASRRSQGNGGRRGGGGGGRRPEELAAAGSNEEPGRRRPWRQEVEMELEHGGRSTAAARAKRGSGRRERGRCGGRGR